MTVDFDLPWRFSTSARFFPNPGRVRQLLELASVKPTEVAWVLHHWKTQPEWTATIGNLLRREMKKVEALLRKKGVQPIQPVKPETRPATPQVSSSSDVGRSGNIPARTSSAYHASSANSSASRKERHTQCWRCHQPIDNLRMLECDSCKGIVCGCGECLCGWTPI